MSSDVDLFAEADEKFDFPAAARTVISAYEREGLQVRAEVLTASFARLDVSSASDRAKVELGLDWRKNQPIILDVGPVLHPDDAVAATRKTNCSALRRITIQAPIARGSRRHSTPLTGCPTDCSCPVT